MRIRSAVPGDLPALVELYNGYVATSTCTFDVEPFPVEARRPWLEQFAAQGRYRLLVADEERLVGYAGSLRFRDKRAYETSIETTVYVAPDQHGKGIATRLYSALFEALRGDGVAGLGDEAEGMIGPSTRVVDLRGRLVTPGMNDAHCHLGAGGLSMLEVDLRGAASLPEIESRVRAAASKAVAGEWITGRGWDQTRLRASELGPGGWPTKETLDRASPQHPVYLRRVDGHTGWVSSRALRLAGIDARTADPPGGEIVRDARGAPTGILKENAQDLVIRVVPPPAPDKLRRGILAALDLAARTGVTSVQSEVTPAELDIYRALRAERRLTVRIYGWLPLTMAVVRALEERGVRAASGDAWVRTGLLKGYADGTLGSRTAWMLEPYSDDRSTRGIQRVPAAEMDALVLAADRAGLQVAVHAIGDAANREVLDALER